MVVRLDEGREAVRAYVSEQASQGLEHVRALVRADHNRIAELTDGLTEDQATRAPMPGEWSIAQVLEHLNASLDRSRARLETMSAGKEWVNPPVAGGQPGDGTHSFEALRREYLDGMAAIIGVLDGADGQRGLDLTAEHRDLGPFSWLEWAVYSHHVHAHDHIGQTQAARSIVKGEAAKGKA